MKKAKKIFCVFFAALFLLCSIPVGAAEKSHPMDRSYVIDDLKKMGYNISDFEKDGNADYIRVITVYEYGYDYHKDFSDYGLYFYIFNPSGKAIQNSDLNKIQMAYKDKSGSKSSYVKFPLQIVSWSVLTNFENMFYKVKVGNTSEFVNRLNSGARTYYVSGIELLEPGKENATDFLVGGAYTFTGYMAGYHMNLSAVDTLYLSWTEELTVPIELHPATWFSKTSDKGEDYRYELFSVYFSIPNDILKQYGDPKGSDTAGLIGVRGEYYEYDTNGILTNNSDIRKNFARMVNRDLTKLSSFNSENNVSQEFLYGFYKGSEVITSLVNYYTYNCSYNVYAGYGKYYLINPESITLKSKKAQTLSPVFYLGNAIYSGDPYLSAEDFMASYIGQGRNHYEYRNENAYGHKYYNLGVSDPAWNSSIRSYASTHDKWYNQISKYFGSGLYDDAEGYADIDVIKKVSDLDVSKVWQDASAAENLFVTTKDYKSLQEFYKSDENKDRTTYLFRFAVRDYYAPQVTVSDFNGAVSETTIPSNSTYYFRKTVFEEFDVLEFTFQDKNSKKTVLPVVASPVDITGGVVPGNNTVESNPNNPGTSNENDSSWFDDLLDKFGDLKLIYKIIIIVLVVLLLALLIRLFGGLLGPIAKGVGWIVAAPFRLIRKGVLSAKEVEETKAIRQERKFTSEDRKYVSEDRKRKQSFEDEDRARKHQFEDEDRAWASEDHTRKRNFEEEDHARKHQFEDEDRVQAAKDRARRQQYEDEDRAEAAKNRKEEKKRQKRLDKLQAQNMQFENDIKKAELELHKAENKRRQENHDYIKSKRGGK